MTCHTRASDNLFPPNAWLGDHLGNRCISRLLRYFFYLIWGQIRRNIGMLNSTGFPRVAPACTSAPPILMLSAAIFPATSGFSRHRHQTRPPSISREKSKQRDKSVFKENVHNSADYDLLLWHLCKYFLFVSNWRDLVTWQMNVAEHDFFSPLLMDIDHQRWEK